LGVPGDGTGPETGNFEKHLCAEEPHELPIASHFVVAPDVVRHGCVDVALQVSVILYPAPGFRVEVHPLALFTTIAAALPGIHCALESGFCRQSARFIEPSIAIAQQGPGYFRDTRVKK